jgi:hypothetical protein
MDRLGRYEGGAQNCAFEITAVVRRLPSESGSRHFWCAYRRLRVTLLARVGVAQRLHALALGHLQPAEEQRGRSHRGGRLVGRAGKYLIVPAFRKHAGQMKRVLSELNPAR